MEQFNYLLNKRNKALGLFNKVLRKLQAVDKEMQDAVDGAHIEIHEHEESIKASNSAIDHHKAAIVYLEKEKAKTLETSMKITALISC